MYFVVYLTEANRNIVIPVRWVPEYEIYLERFFNHSVNTTQTHLCYYNACGDAINLNGQPNSEFEPNFEAEIKSELTESEGCYNCKIIAFKCK